MLELVKNSKGYEIVNDSESFKLGLHTLPTSKRRYKDEDNKEKITSFSDELKRNQPKFIVFEDKILSDVTDNDDNSPIINTAVKCFSLYFNSIDSMRISSMFSNFILDRRSNSSNIPEKISDMLYTGDKSGTHMLFSVLPEDILLNSSIDVKMGNKYVNIDNLVRLDFIYGLKVKIDLKGK